MATLKFLVVSHIIGALKISAKIITILSRTFFFGKHYRIAIITFTAMKNTAFSLVICALLMFVTDTLRGQYVFEMVNGRRLDVAQYNDSNYVDIQYKYDKNSRKNNKIRDFNENLRFNLVEKKGESLSLLALDSLVAIKTKPLLDPKYKTAFVDPAEIFAIQKPDGREVLYEYNEVVGNYFTVDEMEHYVLGQRDALLRFTGKRAFWGGVAAGAVGGFAWQNSIFSVTTPLVWIGIVAIPPIKIKQKYMSDPNLRTEPYKAGFAKTARTKNILQGLKGSVIGTVAGVLIYAVVSNNSSQFR